MRQSVPVPYEPTRSLRKMFPWLDLIATDDVLDAAMHHPLPDQSRSAADPNFLANRVRASEVKVVSDESNVAVHPASRCPAPHPVRAHLTRRAAVLRCDWAQTRPEPRRMRLPR